MWRQSRPPRTPPCPARTACPAPSVPLGPCLFQRRELPSLGGTRRRPQGSLVLKPGSQSPPPPASGQAAPPSHALPSPRPRSLSSRPGPGPHLRHSQNRSNSSGTSPQGTRPSIFVASVSESVLCRSTGDQRGEQVAHRWGAAGRELYPREGPSRALVPPRGSAGPGRSGRGVEVTRGPQVDPGACRRDRRGPGPTAAIWDAPGRRLSVLRPALRLAVPAGPALTLAPAPAPPLLPSHPSCPPTSRSA